MLKYVLRNILMIIPTMLGVIIIVFSINQFTPGDPVALQLGADYTEEQYLAKQEEMGLDDPYFTQLFNYLKGIVTKLDFGTSYSTHRPVITEVKGRIWTSIKLGLLGIALVIVVGVPIGIISATKQGSPLDYSVTFLSLILTSMPNFWLCMILMLIFSLKLGWVPASGLDVPSAYILPVIGVAITSVTQVIRQTRSSMLEVVRQDYITTARAKGLSERTVIYKHALRNALIPVVTLVGMQFGTVFAGSPVIEAIFNIPGMGTLMLNAINSKDYPEIQSVVLILSFIVCLTNVLVDIVYGFLDPRIRAQYAGAPKFAVTANEEEEPARATEA